MRLVVSINLLFKQAEKGSAGEQPVKNILTIRMVTKADDCQPFSLIIPKVDAFKKPLINFSLRLKINPL